MEASTAVHLALQELQSVDLAFHHSVAPRQPESRKQRIFVALQALGEGGQRRSARSFDPLVRCICVASAEQVEQRLGNLPMDASSGEDSERDVTYLLLDGSTFNISQATCFGESGWLLFNIDDL
jgi:hypothetical protein